MLVLLLHGFVVDVVTEGRTVSGTPARLVGPRGNENVISVVLLVPVMDSRRSEREIEGHNSQANPSQVHLY